MKFFPDHDQTFRMTFLSSGNKPENRLIGTRSFYGEPFRREMNILLILTHILSPTIIPQWPLLKWHSDLFSLPFK